MDDEGDGQTGANRKRMLFSRRTEKQTQWVVEMMDKYRGHLEGKCTA